jgi:predicted TIM-barrel fold metal-dependent hydrolase
MSGHTDVPGSAIRAELDHPIVDADAHIVECNFVADDYVREIGGPDIFKRWMNRGPTNGTTKQMWWGQPSGPHTADRAMSMLPRYFATRLDDCGIDFTHMLSTLGIPLLYIRDDEVRQVAARALNTLFADLFKDVGDRIRPVAVIPTFTPQEAIAELEYAVLELGHKAIMIGTEIRRPHPDVAAQAPELGKFAEGWQSIAMDSPYDYDPFWQRCVDLKVAPLCHTSLIGASHRRSPNNYVFNHLGMFAQGSEHFCRALFMGGVTKRFPTLNFGLLEGGVAWAMTLLNDIVEHFEKRNVDHLRESLDPAKIDMDLFTQLFEEYGDARHTAARIRENPFRASDRTPPSVFNEFGASGMTEVADLKNLFCRNFYFGCEADDRMISVAFNRRLSPVGSKLKATFGSDIGPWDGVDATTILGEAYGLVEAGLIDRDDFRDFTWTNPVSLHLGMNPDYFKGTRVEDQAARLLPELERQRAAVGAPA